MDLDLDISPTKRGNNMFIK